jgi:hypothetical protein
MNIEFKFGANKGSQQPSQLSYLDYRKNALLAHTVNRQIFEEIARKTSENFDISTRFWSKSRSYRKQTTKPFLPGATTTTRQAPPHAICESLSTMPGTFERPQIRRTAVPLLSTKDQPTARSREKHMWYNLVLGHSEVACILSHHLSVESSY